LPLKKYLKTVAVIGPNADALEVLLGNYNGTPSKYVTPLAGIKSKVSANTTVLYSPGAYKIGTSNMPVPASALSADGKGSGAGLKAEYFNNRELQGIPVLSRADANVNFEWGALSPASELTPQEFSVRWTGTLTPPVSGKYSLGFSGNGWIRIYLDGQLLVEEIKNRRTKTVTKEVDLQAGHAYDLRFEYQALGNPFAAARLIWSLPDGEKALRDEAVSKAKQADVVIMFLGISPLVEGEEMEVPFEGFLGGDRTDITLPKAQEQLLEQVSALGKPVVLVILNGSALAINWANDHVPAILDAWYPGEEGGAAIADVLFGDYNPAGRLPVTFYKSVDQLPPFTDYSMQGRTYRYFKGTPLYPFGFGLSYTNFKYDKLSLSARRVAAGQNLRITSEVVNAGDRAGDEVVQLYVTHPGASVPVPIRSLAGIQRVFLKPGEKRTVTFTLSPDQMSVIDDKGQRIVEPGEFLISVGGKQPGFSGYADAGTTAVVTTRFSVAGKLTVLPY
jgi:beta-glucosidase